MKQLIITIGTILLASHLYGQGGVGINNNGNAPNTSAMLDVASTNKGLLIPRISLTSTTDATTITNGNVTSLLVYNTVTIADVVPGYYYWDGTVWKTIGGNDADADPTNEIQDLQLVGNNLTITNNGTPTTIDLSAYLDNTDNQNIDSVILNGSNLTVYIEDGTSSAVDLSNLSDHDWYEVGGNNASDNINDDIFTHGNVGIGVTLPIEKLHVRGQTILVENNGGSVFNSTTFGATNTIGPHFIGASSRGVIGTPSHLQTNDILSAFQGRDFMVPGTYSGMHIRASENHTNTTLGTSIDFTTIPNGTTVSQQRMIILNNGNVGIGTTTPNAKLSITTNIPYQGFKLVDGNQGAGLILTSDANGNATWLNQAGFGNTKIQATGNWICPWNGGSSGSGLNTGYSITIPSNGWYVFEAGLTINSDCNDYGLYLNGIGDIWSVYCGGTGTQYMVPRDQNRILYVTTGNYNILARKTNGVIPVSCNDGNPTFYISATKVQN